MAAHKSEWHLQWGPPVQRTVNWPKRLFDWAKAAVAAGHADSLNALFCQALLDHLRYLSWLKAPHVNLAELIHDALDAAKVSYHEQASGTVDVHSGDLAEALIAAGWRPPLDDNHNNPENRK